MKKKQREPWSRRTWKTIAITFISLFTALALFAAAAATGLPRRVRDWLYPSQWDDYDCGWEEGYDWEQYTTTRPGSWDNINQEVGKQPQGWRQIVGESAFNLRDGTYPSIDGSTTMVPLAMEFAWQHLRVGGGMAQHYANFSTTAFAYEKLIAPGDYSMDLFIGTMPGEKELALARQYGVTLVAKPICWDSFVFITHKDNPVESLTVEQLRRIFSGEAVNWKALGGPDRPLQAYQREPGAGSQTGMEALVMQGTPMGSSAAVQVITGMGALVEVVAHSGEAFGIGYTYGYYIENLYKNENIKTLKIDGAAPTDANVVSGAYPLRIERFGVIRQGDEEAPGGLFLDWILSEEGQACVKQAGYIPLG